MTPENNADSPHAFSDEVGKRLDRARTFIRREFRRGPGLNEIADAAGLSPFSFHRRFCQAYGKTPKQMMVELKIVDVQALMRAGVVPRDAAKIAGSAVNRTWR